MNTVEKCEKCGSTIVDIGVTGLDHGKVIHKCYCLRCYNLIYKGKKITLQQEQQERGETE